ncbi:hypothetical protein CLUG_00959 [Clavispora lusitaniae ATCC 42720]|uniref:Uncharacterized protein n=1 Tax=Clavispora lusitaniae (strain ATCC 42720) TaxID=306902 RepID=C4XYD6_CLAL4|nr:uncharacterized protein CLUG_00959 [Clavispora lusitaniae ATCC 42720]EEQ36836.1 hypothetical protein CLUG_00959 [Clavispora lusitaniae ATCC 42720]
MGSPTLTISSMFNFKSNALDKMILKIFCTLMEWLVEQKITGARIALPNRLACWVISSWSCGCRSINSSYFVPTKKGMAVLLKPRTCSYHSFIELRVDFRVRSNINKMATASLETKGSMLINSFWPPKSHIRKVIFVLRIWIFLSMKLTPKVWI